MNEQELRYLGELATYFRVIARCCVYFVSFAVLSWATFVDAGWHPADWHAAFNGFLSMTLALFLVQRPKGARHQPAARAVPAAD